MVFEMNTQVPIKEVINVQTGRVEVAGGDVILSSRAIGSCIALVLYDSLRKAGALAHIMLPGKAPFGSYASGECKYAANAVELVMDKMKRLGSGDGDIKVVVVGAANVLNRKDDTICRSNIESIFSILKEKKLKVQTAAVGGTQRRSVSLDVGRGEVRYSEGDGKEKLLWQV